MRRLTFVHAAFVASALLACSEARAAIAGTPGAAPLSIAHQQASTATIVLAAKPGTFEKRAAHDLAAYIEKMSGAKVAIAETAPEAEAALAADRPLIVLGQEAFQLRPELRQKLETRLKPHPFIRADGFILEREGNRVYAAGSNDRSHYFAVAQLLREWGVRWFMPGPFGECVPEAADLDIGALDEVQATPFEVRSFWVSWLGDQTGIKDFQLHNMMTDQSEVPPSAHALGQYTRGLGTGPFDVPLLAPATIAQVADKTDKLFAANRNFSLAMEDGVYASDDPDEKKKNALQWDPAFQTWAITDSMLTLYEGVLKTLRERHPRSTSKVGFLAYSNMTLPPVEHHDLDRALFAQLAPIDVDPIHGIGDPRSPLLAQYGDWVQKWSAAMAGRLTIYDYDQGMLLWRDLPNPSFMAFDPDVKVYRKAGLLGVSTESRNALATTLVNLYLRGRLLWNPDEKVGPLLDDFYRSFYGPAAAPMSRYWARIFAAWQQTHVTEHEFFVAPAIYTKPLIDKLRKDLDDADAATLALAAPGHVPSRNEALYLERLRFTRLGFKVLDDYIAMVAAGAGEADYATAVAAGERGLGARSELTTMSKSFTTVAMEQGSAFWPGEVQQYDDLLALTDGTRGTLVTRLPLVWNVRRDAAPTIKLEPATERPLAGQVSPASLREPAPKEWQAARTDLYLQAQGIFAGDEHGKIGALWYKSDFQLTAAEARKPLRLHFPGLFGSCNAYINDKLVGTRKQNVLWWNNDYRFDWDVPLTGAAVAGANAVALNCSTDGRMSGLFRRPFVYEPRTH